jgi:chemotaxis protein methyltransferase CheR
MAVPVKRSAAADALETVELELLLEAVFRLYGYDFRDYARTSIRRRVANLMRQERVHTISAYQERVLHDRECFQRFLNGVSVNVSAMFRDPEFFRAFRVHAVPMLRTYPFIRIWQAGCSLGEEAYSMAILLEEEGLYERALIYSTDINEATLRQARDGVYPADVMQAYTQNYLRSGGLRSFSEYYTARYDLAILRPSLQRNIVFSQHNLVSDGPFNEFNVILCRNVMIYFNRPLQERTHALFRSSLGMFGILGLGSHESLRFLPQERMYEPLVPLPGNQKLFRRIV